LHDDTGDSLRNIGREFGSTTGRARRCGWLDLPSLKYSIMINGVTKLFMTKADVMSDFSTIKICTSYIVDGKSSLEIPFNSDATIKPVYTELPGWKSDISAIRDYDRLPAALKSFIEFIENQTGVPVTMVSVGPDREETIFRQ
jgi:adenylosuccinate synthase